MKAWLKGGLIGGLLSIISSIIYYSCGNNLTCISINLYNPLMIIPLKILGPFLPIILSLLHTVNLSFIYFTNLFAFVFWFIIGSFIGLIIGKFRNN
jgi:hypothetical protein